MTPVTCPNCNHHFTPKNDQTQPGCYITHVNGIHRGATVTPIGMCNALQLYWSGGEIVPFLEVSFFF